MRNNAVSQTGPDLPNFRRKLKFVIVLACVVLSLLMIRLWYLQVIKGDELRQRSENNAIRFRKIQPLRGLVMDRRCRVMVDNRPSYDVLYMPTKGLNPEGVVQRSEIFTNGRWTTPRFAPAPDGQSICLPAEKNITWRKCPWWNNALDLPGVYSTLRRFACMWMVRFLPYYRYTGDLAARGAGKDGRDIRRGHHGQARYREDAGPYIRGRRARLVK